MPDSPSIFLITGLSAAGKRMIVSGREHMRKGATSEAERQLDLRYRLGAMTADAYFEAKARSTRSSRDRTKREFELLSVPERMIVP